MTFQTFKSQFAVARDVVGYKNTYLERAAGAVRNRFGHRVRIAALITPPQGSDLRARLLLGHPKLEVRYLGSRSVTP
jgi:hypothetical protein